MAEQYVRAAIKTAAQLRVSPIIFMKTKGELRQYEGKLTALEASSALQAARLNALDLSVTSELLYNRKRYHHSAALAALSIEESGKFTILLSIFLELGKPLKQLWQEYRKHTAKTEMLNFAIDCRIAVVFPGMDKRTRKQIAANGPDSANLELNKQLSLYSDCLESKDGVICHLPKNGKMTEGTLILSEQRR